MAKPIHFRLDFRQTFLKDNNDGTFRVRIQPDPDRYEYVTHRGERYLCDRFTRLRFKERQFFELLSKQLNGMPLYFEPSDISDSTLYVRGRVDAIQSLLSGDGAPNEVSSSAHDELLACLGEGRRFAIVTVYLHNHIEIAALHRKRRRAINVAVTHEIALAAAFHRGNLWRTSATSQSLFFPAPSMNSKTDLALGFATTARDLVALINLELAARELPTLRVGFGIEIGEAAADVSGFEEVHTQVDLAGLVVGVAEEIARHAPAGKIWVGPRAADGCHVSWRRLMIKIESDIGLSLTDDFNQPAFIFELAADAHGTGPLMSEKAV